MRSSLYIGVILVVVAAGGVGVYYAIVDDAPSASEGEDQADAAAGAGTAEREALGAMLEQTEWLVVSDYAHDALLERIEQAKVTLTPAERIAVLPLLAAHLKTLRENLEAAHAAAVGATPRAQRVRYAVSAAKAHGDFQRAVREIVSPETAVALFKALPGMVPPMPTEETTR